jgi:hypothetical protein
MSDATLVPELLRRESRSYLQYAREAFPWAKGKDDQPRARIAAFGEAESAEIARLGRLLQRRHISLPFLGAFPTSFTTSNFVSAAHMVPRLIADQKQKLADLERDLAGIADAELRQQIEVYRDVKRKHLHELESLLPAGKAA